MSDTDKAGAVAGPVEREVRPHTCGPWKVRAAQYANDFGIVDSTGFNVLAECFSDIRWEGEHAVREAAANACLIAAAPELLVVLRKIINSVPFGNSHEAVRHEAVALLDRLD